MCFKGIKVPILRRTVGYKVMKRNKASKLVTPIMPDSNQYSAGDIIKVNTRERNKNSGIHYFELFEEANLFKAELEDGEFKFGFKSDYVIILGKPLSLV